MKKLALVLATLVISACSDAGRARKTLDAAGFTDIQTTGYKFFVCGQDDVSSTGFIAVNPRGTRVRGAVCCKGFFFGGCTVRF